MRQLRKPSDTAERYHEDMAGRDQGEGPPQRSRAGPGAPIAGPSKQRGGQSQTSWAGRPGRIGQ